VLSLQSAGINGTEFDTPQANRFSGYSDASLSEEILDISVAKVEAIVKPNGVANDSWRESVTFIGIHSPILAIAAS
jgi:hypothetical protein